MTRFLFGKERGDPSGGAPNTDVTLDRAATLTGGSSPGIRRCEAVTPKVRFRGDTQAGFLLYAIVNEPRPHPFQASGYDIVCDEGNPIALAPFDRSAASTLAERVVEIDPWRTLGTNPARLASSFLIEEHGLFRRIIMRGAECAGVVTVRYPWLFGPYLMLLVVFPEHQRAGVGSAVLRWLHDEVQGTAGNIWACVSSFNVRAQSFYERHGFERVGVLPDLVQDGFSEILIRKRASKSAAP